MKNRSLLVGALAASVLAFGASSAFAAGGLSSNIVVVNHNLNGPGNVQNAGANGQILGNVISGNGSGASVTAENVEQMSSVGDITQGVGGGLLPLAGSNNTVTINVTELLTSVQPQAASVTVLVQGNTISGPDAAASGLAANVGQMGSVGDIGQSLN